LPTGSFYKPGVKANVLFFDKRPPRADGKPNTQALWIYDFRTDLHFTLKKNPLDIKDLQDFVSCYQVGQMGQWRETERFKKFEVDELLKRDKLNLDIFWLKDESLDDVASLPTPDVIAAEIVENLQAALEAFQTVADELAVKRWFGARPKEARNFRPHGALIPRALAFERDAAADPECEEFVRFSQGTKGGRPRDDPLQRPEQRELLARLQATVAKGWFVGRPDRTAAQTRTASTTSFGASASRATRWARRPTACGTSRRTTATRPTPARLPPCAACRSARTTTPKHAIARPSAWATRACAPAPSTRARWASTARPARPRPTVTRRR